MKSRNPSIIVVNWGVTAPGTTGALITANMTLLHKLGELFSLSNNKIVMAREALIRIGFTSELANTLGGIWAEARVHLNSTPIIRTQMYMEIQAGVYGNGAGVIYPVNPGDILTALARHTETATSRSVQGALSVEEIITN